jgi:small neutral amino acid transporter SnatA (MarC family)
VTNPGRVALALGAGRPRLALLSLALLAGFALVVVAALLADDLLDLLEISPESIRIAAGLVLAVNGLRTLVGSVSSSGPLAAVVTPELALLALTAGADEPVGRVLAAAALALALVAPAALVGRRGLLVPVARFLAALQVVVAVALVVSGVRDV